MEITRRRAIQAGAASMGAAMLWTHLGFPQAAAQAMAQAQHGALRGLDRVDGKLKGNKAKVGRFGFLFPQLDARSWPDDLLVALANTPRPAGMRDANASEAAQDNRQIPAGFTFLSQFVDHDMTFDQTPLAQQQADPEATRNFRQAQLNLDSVYNAAPRVGARLQLQEPNAFGVVDIPRRPDGSAIIGDPRNDENFNLLPIHLGFMRFHNALADKGLSFEAAQQQTRFHYQYILCTEWLPLIVGQDVVDEAIDVRPGKQSKATTRFYKPGNPNKPMMPVEFAVAAYRMGHSMVRNNYNIQRGRRLAILQPTLANPLGSLNGGRPIPKELEQQSDLFFRTATSPAPDPVGQSANDQSFNFSRKLDGSISGNLLNLPASAIGPNNPEVTNLALRNLRRAVQVGLPSGQDVARAVGVEPISNAALGLADPRWGEHAPLWFYLLKEAELTRDGARMGAAGGRVIADVIGGLLDADKTSFFSEAHGFTPVTTPFGMADMFRFSGAI